jgi:hypothetical protein
MAIVNALSAYRLLLGENDAMAYLVNMARVFALARAVCLQGLSSDVAIRSDNV